MSRNLLLYLFFIAFLVGCHSKNDEDLLLGGAELVAEKKEVKDNKIEVKISDVFATKGNAIPKSLYPLLGIKKRIGDLFSEIHFSLSDGSSVCVFTDIPSGCTGFYCYSTYYIALLRNNQFKSLKSVQITLGSVPTVSLVKEKHIEISNEVEQYSSLDNHIGASITDEVIDDMHFYLIEFDSIKELPSLPKG